ncbi:chemotaxis protein CheB [Caldimonas brevitalea]|uniref:protein-glutamate methylesterase n=1 Tax=Caldimonas brevitalea TaxID=413882 RepID=A0A0G3BQH9_9BURK|nr:chemotaxis protein CheB [Caldimonas brevitalea]AKJ30248.1 two-component system, chemotaxis family, response regulator CheB [Caldimonas brevitalea]
MVFDPHPKRRRDVVVIGASAGGVMALQQLVAQLPPDFPAAVLIVLHIGARSSTLPTLLSNAGPLPARAARGGDRLVPGTIYVAPPDHHLVVAEGHTHLTHGPKENHARPAVDPLFRSAAVAYRDRVIAVVLTGYLDDGTTGAEAVEACGGTVVVQNPLDAFAPSMPSSALRATRSPHIATLAEMPGLLTQLTAEELEPHRLPVPEWVKLENAICLLEGHPMKNLEEIAQPSPLTCPDCNGTLWRVLDGGRPRYRCHTGHAFSELALRDSQSKSTEEALWKAVRSLQEEMMAVREMASTLRLMGRYDEAAQQERLLARLEDRADRVRDLVQADAPQSAHGVPPDDLPAAQPGFPDTPPH